MQSETALDTGDRQECEGLDPLRWLIVGTGAIAGDFALGLRETLPDAWLPGSDRQGRDSPLAVTREGHAAETVAVSAHSSVYALEAEVVAGTLGRSLEPAYPALSWADSLANMHLVETWRTLVASGGGAVELDWA